MIGHADQITAFKAAFDQGRLQHAWLLTGPPGLGKALFATLAATWVLAGRPDGAGFDVDADLPAARLMEAGSHLDFKLIERIENPKTGKMRGEIVLEQLVRRPQSTVVPLSDLLRATPALSDYRVIVIDAADDMNPNVANCLLKSLEEPTPKTLFMLISHAPGRLLPTIRSRCRTLRFGALADSDVAAILETQVPDLDADDRAALVRMAQGAPGRALRFGIGGISALEEQLADLSRTPEPAAKAAALARSLAGKGNLARYEALLELAPAMLATAARSQRGPALARALGEWEAASALAGSALALSLNEQQVAFDLAMKVAGIGRLH